MFPREGVKTMSADYATMTAKLRVHCRDQAHARREMPLASTPVNEQGHMVEYYECSGGSAPSPAHAPDRHMEVVQRILLDQPPPAVGFGPESPRAIPSEPIGTLKYDKTRITVEPV